MTDRELMQRALNALEEIADEVFSPYDNKLGDAILALRTAIEQAEQELVCVCGAIWESQELVSSPPSRKPLTHPQIHELDWPDDVSFEDILLFARAIEAAHGIKE